MNISASSDGDNGRPIQTKAQVLADPPVEDLRDRMLRLLVDVEHHLQRRRDLAWDEVELELGGSE